MLHLEPKLRWKMLREFESPTQLQERFGEAPELCWTVTNRMQDANATKLLLSSRTGQRCEAVALFPTHRPGDGASIDHLERNLARPSSKLPRATACISSQPGCGVGCPFCATGELGFRGNLSAAEIVEQVYWAGIEARLVGKRLRNVVYMGMGEPLHNCPQVVESLHLLTDERLFGLPQRRITLSTAGVPAAMVDVAKQFSDLRIALSLHSADPDMRKRLVPRATADLNLLRAAIREVNRWQPNHPLWLEIVLFAGMNDSLADAELVRRFCQDLRVEVNLIPYNTAAGSDQFVASPREHREAYAQLLREHGIRTTIRNSFGTASQSACGQLNAHAE